MNEVINKILTTRRHNVAIKVYQADTTDFGLKTGLEATGLNFEIIDRSTKDVELPFDTIKIPPMSHRVADYELLLPYLFAVRHRDLKIAGSLTDITVDVAWLFLFNFLLQQDASASEIVDSFLAGMDGTHISLKVENATDEFGRALYHSIRQNSWPALWYAGFCKRQSESQPQNWFNAMASRVFWDELQNYQADSANEQLFRQAFVNKRESSPDDRYAPFDSSGNRLPNVVWNCAIRIKLEHIGLAAHNLQHLSKVQPDSFTAQAKTVLEQRLLGQADKVIRKSLMIRRRSVWNELVSEQNVSLETTGNEYLPTDVLKRWNRSKRWLLREADESRVVELHASGELNRVGTKLWATKNGHQYFLSQKQYKVIEYALRNPDREIPFAEFKTHCRLNEPGMSHVFKRKNDLKLTFLKKGSARSSYRLNGKPGTSKQ